MSFFFFFTSLLLDVILIIKSIASHPSCTNRCVLNMNRVDFEPCDVHRAYIRHNRGVHESAASCTKIHVYPQERLCPKSEDLGRQKL
jgi:hypothetical protein